MARFSRLSAWLDSVRAPWADLAPEGWRPLMLTLGGSRFKVRVEMARPARTDDTGLGFVAVSDTTVPADEDRTGQMSVPANEDRTGQMSVPDDEDGTGQRADWVTVSAASPGHLPPPEQGCSREYRPQSSGLGFWDVLEPTEREALRSVASCRTFAAGARIMEEGERADHVMVILGGQVEIRLDENGSERVVAVRGLGQLVGERAALKVSVRLATVVALEMVWALVVQTKDFAAFISAHPRVLKIVQNQQYQLRTGCYHDTDPEGRAAASPPADGDYSVGYSRKRPKTLHGENCTVFLTDVADFGARARTDHDRLLIRESLFKMTQKAMAGFPDAQSEDRGDGFLAVVPPNASTARVLEQLMRELPAALERHNSIHGESARFKLRLAVNVGPVVSDLGGVSGEAIIVAARLVEAQGFKDALAASTASLGVIASPFVYETVIRHGSDAREVASYFPVPVEVKETDTTAWMKLFAAVELSPYGPYPGAPGAHAGH